MAKEHDYESSIFGLLTYLFIVFAVTFLALLGGGAIRDRTNLDKLTFYGGFLVACVLIIIIDKAFLKKYDFTYIHDSDKALVQWEWFSNPTKLFLLSFLVFVPLIGCSILANKSRFVGFYKFQALALASTWLSGEPASFTETLILATLFGFISFFFTNLFKGNEIMKYVSMLIAGAISVWTMFAYHLWRYGSQELALQSVIAFFTLEVILLILTGSIIPLVVSHFVNNFFGGALSFMGNEIAILIAVTIYVVLLALYVAYLLNEKKVKKNL